MANVLGGTFEEDLASKAWESGNSSSAQTQPNTQNNNPFLSSSPYLNPGAIDLNAARGEAPQFQRVEFSRVETRNQNGFKAGSMSLTLETMNQEHRIKQLKEQLNYFEHQSVKIEELIKEEREEENQKENKFKKQAENAAASTILTVNKVSKGIFGFFKAIFGAAKSLYKENIGFKIYTKEQKQKIDEENAKKAKQGAEQSSFFSKIKNNSKEIYYSFMKSLNDLEERLEIAGLTTELRNKYLGRRRNLSYQERNIHLAHFTARGLMEEREEKLAEQKRVKFEAENRKSSPLDMNKIAEGGSILSTTGGQGAG